MIKNLALASLLLAAPFSTDNPNGGTALWQDAGAGNITPNPQAGLNLTAPVIYGAGADTPQVLMSYSEPSITWRLAYVDGGAYRWSDGGPANAFGIALNPDGLVEFNSQSFAGTGFQTFCEMDAQNGGLGCSNISSNGRLIAYAGGVVGADYPGRLIAYDATGVSEDVVVTDGLAGDPSIVGSSPGIIIPQAGMKIGASSAVDKFGYIGFNVIMIAGVAHLVNLGDDGFYFAGYQPGGSGGVGIQYCKAGIDPCSSDRVISYSPNASRQWITDDWIGVDGGQPVAVQSQIVFKSAVIAAGDNSFQFYTGNVGTPITFSPAFASGNPHCWCEDTTALAVCRGTATNTTITITGTGTDAVNLLCIGIK